MPLSSGRAAGRWVAIGIAVASGVISAAGLAIARGAGPFGGDAARFLGRFHPLAVHLPIGAIVLVALFEGLALATRRPARFDDALDVALPASCAAGAGSFVLGLLLAGSGAYPAGTVAWHRGLTLVAIALLAATTVVFTASRRSADGEGRAPFRALLASTLIVLSVGAHFGGTLSRGEGYLTRYAPEAVRRWLGEATPEPPAAAPVAIGPEPLVYADVVAPMLDRTCVSCHGPKEAKGKLRVDSLEALLRGGDDGPALVAGQGAKSPLYARVALPESDDDHMPPADHPQPTEAERELLRFWIDRGAGEGLRVADALPPPTTRALLEGALAARAAPKPIEAPPPACAPATTAEPEAPAPPAAPVVARRAAPASAGGTALSEVVMPVLRARCEKCHGAEKQKGKLRVDSLAALLAGGKGGPAIVAGSSARSPLVTRIRLAPSDEGHMPPVKSPQPSEAEVAALAWWIDHGADDRVTVGAMPASLRGSAPPAGPEAPAPRAGPEAAATTQPRATQPPAPAGPRVALPASLRWEADVILPLLRARCGDCHGGDKPEGGLSFKDAAALHAAGDSGPAFVAGAPEQSSALARIALPEDDDEHMPPSLVTQMSPAETALLAAWVRAGAAEGELATDGLPDDQRAVVAALLPAPPSAPAAAPPLTEARAAAAGAVPVAPPGAGCAACAVGAVTGGVLPAASALAIVVLLVGRRAGARRRSREV
jgi:uncharacterized membrane protein